MQYLSWEISIIAFLPALFLCGFVYYKDRVEREPIGLLALLFLAGGIAYLPGILAEKGIAAGLDLLFGNAVSFSADGMVRYSSGGIRILHQLLQAFLGIAAVEVALKWCVLYFITRNNRNFNYLFDGIVYSVFVSLGYAAAENVWYAWTSGWDTLVMRSLSSIPCHLFVGIFMGYYYTMWHVYRHAEQQEEALLQRGLLQKKKIGQSRIRLTGSLVIPFLVAGICIFAGSVDARALRTIFYFVVFSLYGMSFLGVDHIATRDMESGKCSVQILKEKHPEAARTVWEQMDAGEKTGTDAEDDLSAKGEEE